MRKWGAAVYQQMLDLGIIPEVIALADSPESLEGFFLCHRYWEEENETHALLCELHGTTQYKID